MNAILSKFLLIFFFEIKLILKLKSISRRKKKLQKDLEEAADTTTQQDVNLKEFISNP
jgi:hypothetical protein